MPLKRLVALLLGLDEDSFYRYSLSDDLLDAIVHRSLQGSFVELAGEDGTAMILRMLDRSGLSEHTFYIPDKPAVCRLLYNRLHESPGAPGIGFDRFEIAFDRFVAGLREGLAYHIEPQLIDLEYRELSHMSLDDLSRVLAPEGLFYHMYRVVSHFLDNGVISATEAEFVVDMVEKMASAPGYTRFLGDEKKHEETAMLYRVAAAARSSRAEEDDMLRDLIVAVGLMLYNLCPTEQAAEGLSSVRPSDACPELQYQYNAVLALNYTLSGRPEPASRHAALAAAYAGDTGMQAYVGILQGCIAIRQGNPDDAAKLLEQACTGAPGGRIKALALFYRGLLSSGKKEYESAIGSFREAAANATDPMDLATIYNNMGLCAVRLGDLSLAEACFAEMDGLSGRLDGDAALRCRQAASSRFGALLRARGEYARAIERYRQALQLALRSGDRTAIANQVGSLGVTYARAGEREKAFHLLNACMACSERAGYWAGIRFAYWHIQHMLDEGGNSAEARKFRETYVTKYPELKDPD